MPTLFPPRHNRHRPNHHHCPQASLRILRKVDLALEVFSYELAELLHFGFRLERSFGKHICELFLDVKKKLLGSLANSQVSCPSCPSGARRPDVRNTVGRKLIRNRLERAWLRAREIPRRNKRTHE